MLNKYKIMNPASESEGGSSVSNSVAKTAMDAINAKLSLIDCHYTPIPHMPIDIHNVPETSEHPSNCPKDSRELYTFLLRKIIEGDTDADTCSGTGTRNQKKVKVKRQTPLVNAGYAIRVSTIASSVVNFIRTKTKTDTKTKKKTYNDVNESSSKKVNLMFLGCGLDITGVWANIISANSTNHDLDADVQVYEVDCIHNCKTKRQAFLHANIMEMDHDNDDDGDDDCNNLQHGTILKGRIKTGFESDSEFEHERQMASHNYTLMAADLRDIPSLENAINASSFDRTLPTLIVSELVLAYLNTGGNGDFTDRLIQYISTSLCCSNDSMFLAYEPVFPDPATASSVVCGHAKDYFGQFVSKLDRGIAVASTRAGTTMQKQTGDAHVQNSSFAPIGQSPADVINRLRRNGFDGMVDCTPMANAVHILKDLSDGGQPPELFDEYASYWLHLSCYSVVCATGTGIGSSSKNSIPSYLNVRDYRAICPWIQDLDKATAGCFRLFKELVFVKKIKEFDGEKLEQESSLILTSIKSGDQEQVRNLFKNTYSQMFEEFPSVKKLVKSALKTDLNARNPGTLQQTPTTGDIDNTEHCSIWKHYSNENGAFFVVKTSTDEENTNGTVIIKECNSKVVGCIGVKKSLAPSKSVSDDSISMFYEINRLCVDPTYRGDGIGRILLNSVENFVRSKVLSGVTVGLFASTPEVLEAANGLYSSNGFFILDESQIGKMTINTYLKRI